MHNLINFKKFTFLSILFIIIYLIYHITIWTFYSSKIFGRTDGMYIGDLGRMSYQVDSLYPRKLHYTLKKRILNIKPYMNQKIDILTIGDSFSNGITGGKNPYYQDYLANKYNLNILNIKKIQHQHHQLFETIISLYNNGWLKKHKPKLIIIESVQSSVYDRFTKKFNFKQTDIKINGLIIPAKTKDTFIPHLSMINTANYKIPFYTIKYKFKIRAQKDVVKLNLSKNLFSTKEFQHSLLFHYSNITQIKNNQTLVNKINANFNKLAKLLKTLNIQLLFLVAPDKYSVYSNYLENNPFPKNNFFQLIGPLKKNYLFINTEAILKKELQKNVKDLYYSDDTHWSYKASDKVTDNIIFQQFKRLK